MLLTLFWLSLAGIVITYFVFPALLVLRGRWMPRPCRARDVTPRISVLIAAYNEAHGIRQRIDNLFAQDYPADGLEVIIASDGSTDGTDQIVQSIDDPRVKVLSLPRQGKGAALNRAVQVASGEILVFSDANTVFAPGTLRALVRPFADPQVGGVAGNQVYLRDKTPSLTADGERAYWSFDRLLKESQSRAGSVTSATGAIYAIRRQLYQPIPADAMDDFIVSTAVVGQGRRLVFATDATAYEPVAVARGVEYSRKLRIVTQGLRAVWHQRRLLNPRRYGFYAVQLCWHKVLRRIMVFPLISLLACSLLLWSEGPGYRLLAMAQVVFCSAAATGYLLRSTRAGTAKALTVPYYFCAVNLAALVAVFNCLTGRSIRRWEPERHACSHQGEAAAT